MYKKRRFSTSRFRSKKKNFGDKIDPSKYIKRAVEQIKVEEYVSKHKFSDFNVSEKLKNNIISKGYEIPTPIQDQAIPVVLEGRDVIGIANTGTGKTAAFLIPLINKVMSDTRQTVLVIVPTRELAQQIREELIGFTRGLGLYSALPIGGVSQYSQIKDLRNDPEFIIGTPGRILDLFKQGYLNLKDCNNIVLDEVDRMLDMGFLEDIKTIISHLPEQKQSLFFSATLPAKCDVLISNLLKNPIKISVKIGETSHNVDQDIIRVRKGEAKFDKLHELLSQSEFAKVIVFGRTKRSVEKLSNDLVAKGIRSVSIHGDKTQSHRQRAITLFKTDSAEILVATDVAARGLDIPNVSHVINYDEPATYEDYTHRIGRTGRGSKKGIALTFVEIG